MEGSHRRVVNFIWLAGFAGIAAASIIISFMYAASVAHPLSPQGPSTHRSQPDLRTLTPIYLPPKPPAPSLRPFAATLKTEEEAAVAREGLNEVAQRYGKECHGVHITPTRLAQRLYDGAGESDRALEVMIEKACGYKDKMLENGLRQPLYVQVGAKDARHMLHAVKAGCRVMAFEPSPTNFKKVSDHVAGAPEVKVVPFAVADRNGTAKFRVATHERGGSGDALVGSRAQYEPGMWWHSTMPSAVIDVNTTTLDDALRNETLVSVVSIDARGWELDALRGARFLLDSHRIQNLRFLMWPVGALASSPDMTYPRKEAFDLLNHLYYKGFTLHHSDPQSLHVRQAPPPPRCAAEMLDYLIDSERFDAFGLWVDIFAAK